MVHRLSTFRTALLTILLLALTGVTMYARTWSADDIPMVHLQDRNRYVSDPDGILTPAMRDSADFYLAKLQQDCGIQTVFIVADHVKNADPFRMAQDVGNKYGVGQKGENRGLVIVLAVGDRSYFIAPGKGLEGDLTDVESDDIARACIVKNMRVNQPDLAVVETAKALYQKFKTGKTGIKAVDNSEEMALSDWMNIIILLLIIAGLPTYHLIIYISEKLGLKKPSPKKPNTTRRRRDDDDWIPPFIFGGGGGFGHGGGGGFSGGSFGGGSFGGGGAGGGW